MEYLKTLYFDGIRSEWITGGFIGGPLQGSKFSHRWSLQKLRLLPQASIGGTSVETF